MSIIVLDSTTKSLKVNLSGAVANTNPSFVVTFADTTATAFTEASSDGVLNGTSNVTVVAAPAIATRRVIKNLIIKNNDTAAVTVNLFLDNNGTSRNIAKVTLAVDDTWTLSGTFSSNGSLKQTLGTNNLDLTGTTSAQALTVTGATTLSAGTANGVLYLNGSKVATTGSALTFNGTSLGVGSSSYGDAGTITASIGVAGTTAGGLQLWAGSAQEHYIQWGDSTTGSATYAGAISYSHASDFMRFWVNSSEQMRLNSTGLGIGTSSPGAKLDVQGIGAVIRLKQNAAGSATYYQMDNTVETGGKIWRFGYSGGSGIPTFSLFNQTDNVLSWVADSSGNLGLGVTPSAATFKTLQIGNSNNVGSLSQDPSYNDFAFGSNCYLDTTWKYRKTGEGAALFRAYGYDGQFFWQRAGSGTAGNTISWTTAMMLDASGNLLVGTTSSVASTKLVVSGINATAGVMSADTSGSTSFVRMLGDATSGNVLNWQDGTVLRFATSTQAFGTFAERARITSGGDFGVGTTSPGARLHVTSTSANQSLFEYTTASLSTPVSSATVRSTGILSVGAGAGIDFVLREGTTDYVGGRITTVRTDSSSNQALAFYTGGSSAPTEKARITSGGYFKASSNGTYAGSTGAYHELYNTATADWIAYFTQATATSPNGVVIQYSAASPNGLGNTFLYCGDFVTVRATIRSNGGLANYSANNVNLSDRREKTNFAPAKSYLNTICAIPVQTFNYIDQNLEEDAGLTLGVVAQDVQAVAPELVTESNWGTEDNPKMRLSIYQTDLQYALMKCIQEQQALITALTARVAALEGTQP